MAFMLPCPAMIASTTGVPCRRQWRRMLLMSVRAYLQIRCIALSLEAVSDHLHCLRMDLDYRLVSASVMGGLVLGTSPGHPVYA